MQPFKIKTRIRASPRQVLRQIGGQSNNIEVQQTCVQESTHTQDMNGVHYNG